MNNNRSSPAVHYDDKFHWEPDKRAFKPLYKDVSYKSKGSYEDVKLTHRAIHGYTPDEFIKRKAASRLVPSFQTTPKQHCELNKTTPKQHIDNKSGLRAQSEPSVSKLPVSKEGIPTKQHLYTGGNAEKVLRLPIPGPTTTPLHNLCASERLLTITGLSGTLKRNPLAVNQVDGHHRIPLHWLMLNPRLKPIMLVMYLEHRDGFCKEGIRTVDKHGEQSAIDYFMEAHQRIGYAEWKNCLQVLAKNSTTAELLHEADPFYALSCLSAGTGRSAKPLMKLGGRIPRIRCDNPVQRQHLQGNPQMMHKMMVDVRTTDHPDEIRGYEMRNKEGHQRTKVGGEIGLSVIKL